MVTVGSRLKPMRTGHKQGEMQLIAFTCRPRQAQPPATKQGKAEQSPKLRSEKQECRFLLLQCYALPRGSTCLLL
jgi:hypothetical protein